MLRPVTAANGQSFSFLEYTFRGNGVNKIPQQYMILNSSGYVGNYTRNRRVVLPQITTNTALDFTLLQ